MPDIMNRIHFNKIGRGGGGGLISDGAYKECFFIYRRRPINGEVYKKREL